MTEEQIQQLRWLATVGTQKEGGTAGFKTEKIFKSYTKPGTYLVILHGGIVPYLTDFVWNGSAADAKNGTIDSVIRKFKDQLKKEAGGYIGLLMVPPRHKIPDLASALQELGSTFVNHIDLQTVLISVLIAVNNQIGMSLLDESLGTLSSSQYQTNEVFATWPKAVGAPPPPDVQKPVITGPDNMDGEGSAASAKLA